MFFAIKVAAIGIEWYTLPLTEVTVLAPTAEQPMVVSFLYLLGYI